MSARDLTATRLWAIRQLSVGGQRWTVTRHTGDGVGAPRTAAVVGVVRGYLWQDTRARTGQALPGAQAPVAPWRFARVGGLALQADDHLEDEQGHACRVVTDTGEVTAEVWEVERT